MALLRISGIVKNSIVDGDGLRYTIFTQGCSHGCKGCHNKSTWDFKGGKKVNTKTLLNDIKSDPIIDGITLSGGDPMFQADKLIDLCKEIKKLGLSIWLYTGFKYEDIINKSDKRITYSMIELLKYIDIMVDGLFILEKRTLELKFRGSTNQRIINVQQSLKENRLIEW